jgi:hypothetical protein
LVAARLLLVELRRLAAAPERFAAAVPLVAGLAKSCPLLADSRTDISAS